MVTKNEVGGEGVCHWFSAWDFGVRGLFAFWTFLFCVKLIISVFGCYSLITGNVLTNREGDANLQGFAFFVSSANKRCDNNVTFPQLQCFWPFHTFDLLCLFAGWIFDHWVWHRLFKKTISCANTNGAVTCITESNILTPLRIFIMSSPIYKVRTMKPALLHRFLFVYLRRKSVLRRRRRWITRVGIFS